MSIEDFQPKNKRELSPEAKDLILTFQKAKFAKSEEEQSKLIDEFHTKLCKIVVPSGEKVSDSIPRISKVLLEGAQHSSYIPVGGGTDGQRIWIRENIVVYGEDELSRLGKNAVVEEGSRDGIYAVTSKDFKPRWMAYYEPTESSRRFGEKYWKRYMEAFGHETVDLLQEL